MLWEFQRAGGTVLDTFYSFIFVPIFLSIWAGFGIALHPKVTTPGALIANISLEVRQDLPFWRLAVFGIFAYYGVFIPLFKIFALGVEVKSRMRTV